MRLRRKTRFGSGCEVTAWGSAGKRRVLVSQRIPDMQCPICQHEASFLREVHAVAYFRCHKCESFFAHPDFLAAVELGYGRELPRLLLGA